MIIFGVSVFYIFGLIGTGHFHCPHCGGDRDYEHRTARRFFTLFFLPVIPLDKVGEVVRCKTCRTKFDPIVLSRPTTAQLASALPAGMRAAASVVLRAGGLNDATARAAVDAVREAGAGDYDLAHVQADANQPIEYAAEPLRALSANFTQDACERQLANAVRIALADGPLSQPERDAVHWIADKLGMTPAHATGVIATVEQSIRG
ncbi:zinc-ribbon domain-containing protein [Asanoa sp. WMMD1127]|uniref:zinc-ribbon domain-containing protein n=1 Tax=Asanoa sp. WMMD1127 TaxID=3016107 RepID=UPI002417FE3D|nr:zinc-ribbon domain-containing protein [Asanoa sp. WMMD1127]MDG4823847.1 zinc-ribbon domain-containing protein [Asanoa sp. WMMD1127]